MAEKILSEGQARVLGSLIEKQITTPLNYPLTQNAVKLACNQKSNRDPVVDFGDNAVFDLLEELHALGYVKRGSFDLSRTTKYSQHFEEVHGFAREETVILCELFLRGPQTPGELRIHCERMRPFKDLAEVERTLEGLKAKDRVVMLERLPGHKENRWAHLFCGEPKNLPQPSPAGAAARPSRASSDLEDRVSKLEEQLINILDRLYTLESKR
jgi:uncharacterized protein YceH (UPF0502 family)